MIAEKLKNNICLNSFERDIWSKLDSMDKEFILKKFDLDGYQEESLKEILAKNDLEELPFGLAIVALNLMEIDNKELYLDCIENSIFADKLTFDKENWGIIRTHTKFYNLLKKFDFMSEEEKKRFEQLLKSSISLDKSEKIDVLIKLRELKDFQISMLLDVFESEAISFSKRFIKAESNITDRVIETESEWREIESNLDFYINFDGIKEYGIDESGDLTPLSIKKRIELSLTNSPLINQVDSGFKTEIAFY